MTTIRTRTKCRIKRVQTTYDKYGRPKENSTYRATKCAIVWIKDLDIETTVRNDSSASRGSADQNTHEVRLMFHPRDMITVGDIIEINDKAAGKMTLQASMVQRRLDINGSVHHIQVDGDRWASE